MHALKRIQSPPTCANRLAKAHLVNLWTAHPALSAQTTKQVGILHQAIFKYHINCKRLSIGARASLLDNVPSQALEYETLAQPARMEVEIKKSRFLVTAWPVTSPKQAMSLIKDYTDLSASHNCFAYRIGDQYRSSDDGEPGGTAGRPILSAIEGEDLQGVAVLVTRYYGGVKLGAGGLVRAYGGAARDCLRASPKTTVKARLTLQMRAGFEVLGTLFNLLDKYQCERLCEDYEEGDGDDPQVLIQFSIEAATADDMVQAVSDATSGKVMPELAAAKDDEETVDE